MANGKSEPFRILDLGCHDGYVTTWLSRILKEEGVDVHVDGIELNPDACAIAERRLKEEGVLGRVVQGMAEDASCHFDEGSYDAVIAYEVIEHVPDMDYSLSCWEAMCKPTGRVYISTPDGCFGTGNNPHHLRALRIIDLAELLRRRGRLKDMTIGRDGVSVCSYTPFTDLPLGEVAIFTGGAWEPWSPMDIETKGLGGSETAAVRLAEALSDKGWTVTVYGEVEPQGCFQQVVYRHYTCFDPMTKRDAVISSRLPEIFDRPINAKSTFLWLHDTDCQDRLTPERAERIDNFMVLSGWHLEHVLNTYPFLLSKNIHVTSNGVNQGYFTGPTPEREVRAIYSSSPDRGLDLLLQWWPEVREQVPNAELVYCYASVYDAVAEQQPLVRDFRNRILELAKQPGVRNLGSLPQHKLAEEMQKSAVWCAPSYNTVFDVPFYETFCIGAVESALAGCYRVGSKWGALAERKLDCAVPMTSDYRPDKDKFIAGIVEGLKLKGAARRSWAEKVTWKQVADDFEANFALVTA